MNKNEFLQNEDVSSFTDWLVERLPALAFHLDFAPSRFVPGGLRGDVTGIGQVLNRYVWNTSWMDDGKAVQSGDWDSTRVSLQRLRRKLLDAFDAGDENALLSACLGVLEWGGVSGAKPFLRRKARNGQLAAYLGKVHAALALDAESDLDTLDGSTIERFDAGLTKIHALFDTSGLPIYDSRVGAAISMLYARYRAEAVAAERAPISMLNFPSGGARGTQIRNPKLIDTGYRAAPQFYTSQVSDVTWARSQVRLGWILENVLKRTDWFARNGADLPARCHAFEAALFMIGYDLRCLSTPGEVAPAALALDNVPSDTGWVPTGHAFNVIFPKYVEYRKALGAEGEQYDDARGEGYTQWLIRQRGPAARPNAAQADRFPFKQAEFDLFGRSLDEILEIRDAIENDDDAGILKFLGDFAIQSDERRNVCLVDVWCVGYLADKGLDRRSSIAALVDAGLAGKVNSGSTLYSVGRNVGCYLKLLDADMRPTPLFRRYFGDGPGDLPERLNEVA